MLLTDGEIKKAMEKEELVIENFSEDCLEPASYDMRLGKKALVSGKDAEINIERTGSITIGAAEFALFTTYEKVKLSNVIVGHIGLRSYFARKGLVLLAGIQVDPTFEGILVLGAYNASSRRITLDYLDRFCTVEFHRLNQPVKKAYHGIEEQRLGRVPQADKDYLRTMEVESLSDLSESVRRLTENVSTLTTISYKIVLPLLVGIFLTVVAFGLGLF